MVSPARPCELLDIFRDEYHDVPTMAFYLVQPYMNGPDRFRTATIVRSFPTAELAFAELEQIAQRLQKQRLAGDAIELVVVDELRNPLRIDG